MNTHSTLTQRTAALAATTMLVLGATTLSATARPDPGEATVTIIETARDHCLLERVGTQYVRCDYLTGNGVPAPAWVPELCTGLTPVAGARCNAPGSVCSEAG